MGKENPIIGLVKQVSRNPVGRALVTLGVLSAVMACDKPPEATPTPTIPPAAAASPTALKEEKPTPTLAPETREFPSGGVYSRISRDEKGAVSEGIIVSLLADGRFFFAYFNRAIPCSDGRTTPGFPVKIIDKGTTGYTRDLNSFKWSSSPQATQSIDGGLKDNGVSGKLRIEMPLPGGSSCSLETNYAADHQGDGENALLGQFMELTGSSSITEARDLLEKVSNHKLSQP